MAGRTLGGMIAAAQHMARSTPKGHAAGALAHSSLRTTRPAGAAGPGAKTHSQAMRTTAAQHPHKNLKHYLHPKRR